MSETRRGPRLLREWFDTGATTQVAFAAKVSVSHSYLWRLLKSERTPSMAVATRIERETGGTVKVQDWAPVSAEDEEEREQAA